MRKVATYIICLLICMLVGASCIDRPEYVLDEEQMVDLLVDVHKAEGLMETQTSLGTNQENQKAIMAAVLVNHGVSRAQYDSSLMWYARHLKLLVRVYSHVDERLLEEQDKWSALSTDIRDFAVSEAGDSVQLWSMRNYLVLDHTRKLDRRFWELEADSNFLAGDTLRWTFDVNHLVEGQALFATISFMREEKNDMGVRVKDIDAERRKYIPIGQAAEVIRLNGPQVITAVPDSIQKFVKAYISVTLFAPDSARQQSPVFLNNLSLTRYHCE